ncbi:MAG: glycosyl transferase [Gammaproteobacteria bacterium]|nr:MAG: glycosyl transferase [Gammaproteobacteria bacterium]
MLRTSSKRKNQLLLDFRTAITVRIAIIIPCLNESENMTAIMLRLQPLREKGHHIIVVDGLSDDNSVELATPFADQVAISKRGRAQQMNYGATLTDADVLWFVHADTALPQDADQTIIHHLSKSNRQWGRFDVQLSGKQFWLRLIEFMMNQRSCLSGIATGDQAIFVHRDLFKKSGGFKNIELMEDISLCKKLKHYSKPICLKEKVITSSRRWETQGVWRTILLMWRLRLAYFFGADPKQLKRRYDNMTIKE